MGELFTVFQRGLQPALLSLGYYSQLLLPAGGLDSAHSVGGGGAHSDRKGGFSQAFRSSRPVQGALQKPGRGVGRT